MMACELDIQGISPLTALLALPCFRKPKQNLDFISDAAQLLRNKKETEEIKKFRSNFDQESLQLGLLGKDDNWGSFLSSKKRSITMKMRCEESKKKKMTIYGDKPNHPVSPAVVVNTSYYFILSQHYGKRESGNGEKWIESNDKGYNPTSASDLILLLRDKSVHSGDMPQEFQASLGWFTEKGDLIQKVFIDFVNTAFPNLIHFAWLKFHELDDKSLSYHYSALEAGYEIKQLPDRIDAIVQQLEIAVSAHKTKGKDGSVSIEHMYLPAELFEKLLDSSKALVIRFSSSSIVSSWYDNLKENDSLLEEITALQCNNASAVAATTTTLIITRMENIECLEKVMTTEKTCNVVVCTAKNDFYLTCGNLEISKTKGLSLLAVTLAANGSSVPFLVLMEKLAKYLISVFVKDDTDAFFQTDNVKNAIKKTTELLNAKDYLNLFPGTLSYNWEEIELVMDTIPPPCDYYTTQILSSRDVISQRMFVVDCPDVFVFKNIEQFDLSKIAGSHETMPSAEYLTEMDSSCRFVFLSANADWGEIRDNHQRPTHLVRYENQSENFFLEETTGESEKLQLYLSSTHVQELSKEKRESSKGAITEEQLVQQIIDTKTHYCICGPSGVGKSLLVANIARNIKQKCPERIVVLLSLSDMMEIAEKSQDIEMMIFDFISTSPVASRILKELFKHGILHLDLCLDGLDEVYYTKIPDALMFLSSKLCKLPNTRLIVTSRPRLRQHLEETLKVISYDILPFTQRKREELLVNIWKLEYSLQNEDNALLTEFAGYVRKEFQRRCNEDGQDFTGFPLQCNLLAKVYAKGAKRYCTSKGTVPLDETFKMANSLPQLFREYVNQSLETFDTLAQTPQNVRGYAENHHTWIALEDIFPAIANEFAFEFGIRYSSLTMISAGLLEKRFSASGQTIAFTHRALAEFMAAEFLLKALQDNPQTSGWTDGFSKLIFLFIRYRVLADESGTSILFVCYELLTYFVNHALHEKPYSWFTDNGNLQKAISCAPPPERFMGILFSCASYNYIGVYRLITNLLSRASIEKPDYRELHELVRCAVQQSSLRLIKEILHFILQKFQYDVIQDYKDGKYSTRESILQVAVSRGEFHVAKYFIDKVPIQESNLISHCLKASPFEKKVTVDSRISICNLLISKNLKSVEQVNDEHIGSSWSIRTIPPGGIKWLAEKGADLLSKSWDLGSFLFYSLVNISNNELHDTCCSIINNHTRRHTFTVKITSPNGFLWRSGLHFLLAKRKKLDFRTIKLIVQNCDEYIFKHGKFINTLLLTALGANQPLGIVEFLFQHHPNRHQLPESAKTVMSYLRLVYIDSSQLNEYGATFLHLASENYGPEEYHKIINFISSERRVELFHQKTYCGRLPLHYAVSCMEMKEETLRLFQDAGVDFNAIHRSNETSLLMHAVGAKRSVNFLKILIDLGVDVDKKCSLGKTFMEWMSEEYCATDYQEITRYLMDKNMMKQ